MYIFRKNSTRLRVIIIMVVTGFSYVTQAQTSDSTRAIINNFAGAVTIQSKGISTIPNLTLGRPAAVFDMKLGRKLTFEPQFRFALDGKPWAMVFWWRYYGSFSDKLKVTLHANHSLSYKSITSYTSTGTSQELIRATRYLVVAVAPNYQINKYINAGLYLHYAHGIEKFITRNTWMTSFRPVISNIPVAKNISARISPEIYYLKLDTKDGVYLNASFSISKTNFPLSVSGLINKPLKSNIPSEFDLLWNVGLSYTFNKKYIEAQSQ
ncbi:MAG: hypothetical protein HPY62_07450 [Bacteroidales bacterium]|nr:hypothetical protein [Bacteroidales bacterium]